jgi:hypothetical protein
MEAFKSLLKSKEVEYANTRVFWKNVKSEINSITVETQDFTTQQFPLQSLQKVTEDVATSCDLNVVCD